jgi:ribonucleoside-triphosphate reductase
MRTLEEVEQDLTQARETLSSVEGTPAEVYSRIVGYYRSVRNWNRGKREEYGERRLYDLSRLDFSGRAGVSPSHTATVACATMVACAATAAQDATVQDAARLLLFWRPACPVCPSAKEAAGRLGIPVDLVNADTEAGFAEAIKRNVLATPTAILLSAEGAEIGRALDPHAIAAFGKAAYGQAAV